jgi:PAS domain S-box-containing protein
MRTWIERGVSTRPWLTICSFAAAYFVAAGIGQFISLEADTFTILWLPAGLYLSALLMSPLRRWPLLIVGAAAGNVAFDLLLNDRGLATAMGFWLINTVAAMVAAAGIGAAVRAKFQLDDLRSMLALALGGVVGGPLLSATLAAGFLWWMHGLPPGQTWHAWLMGDALGVLLTAPLLLSRRPARRADAVLGLSLEAVAWLAAMAAGIWLVFHTAPTTTLRPYVLLPLLLWPAIRFGVFGAAAATTLLSLLSLALTARGYGPFGGVDPSARVLILQPQLAIFGLTTLLVAVLFRQQKQTLSALRQANLRLEQRVAERTAAVAASEAQARSRLEELEFIYANAPVGLGVIDENLRFQRINERLAEINGLPIEAHIGYSVREILPDLADSIEPLLREVLSSGQPKLGLEICGATPAQPGVQRTWIENWLPVHDAQGRVVAINMVCDEVTEQRRIEAALRDSERRFRQFTDLMDGVLWMRDIVHERVLYASPSFETLWGRSREQLYDNPDVFLEGVHPDDRQRVEEAFFRDVAIGVYNEEYRVLRPDGSLRWVRDHGFPVHDDAGNLAYVAGIAEDITADRAAREELAYSEQRFRLAARAAQGMVYEWDKPTGRVWRSEGLHALLGFNPDEAAPTTAWWRARVAPEDLERTIASLERIAQAGEDLFESEYRIQHRNGEWIDVWERAYVERDSDDNVCRAIGHVIDVTERRRAQAAMAASEERYRVAADALQGVVYDWDVVTDRVVRSDGLEPLLGFKPEDVPADAGWWRARMHPEDEQRVTAQISQAAASGERRVESEFRIRHHDHHWVWVLDRSWLQRDAHGRLTRVVGSAMDITDRRRSEAALSALADAGRLLGQQLDAESACRTLVAAVVPKLADIAAVWLPRHGRSALNVVRHVDPSREAEAVDVARREFPRRSEGSALDRALSGEVVLVEHVADDPASAVDELQVQAGAQLGVRSALLLPLTARGETLGVLAMALAGSEEHAGRHYTACDLPIANALARRGALAIDNAQLHETTQRALAQLQVQDRRKTEFLSMLAHELRNPLTPIRNAAEVLGVLAHGQPQYQQIADVLRRQTHKMARLVDDLLDMARITHGKVKLERVKVNLIEVINQAADTLRQQAAARQQTITIKAPAGPVWVDGDALRLEQVLINLLSNACKFGDHGDAIELTLDANDHEASICVRDHGTGIAPALLPHVFDLFTQDERTPDRKHGGLGIGLSLARSLVEMHGGQINVHSEGPNTGATFVVRLPVVKGPNVTRVAAASAAPASTTPVRVLIAEDNADAADTLALLLRGVGYAVQVARSGPEAVALASEFRPQVVLLDIGLPGMDGFQVAARLRLAKATAHVLIAAVSGYGDADSKRKAHAVGIDEYFVKPLDTFALLRMLEGRVRAEAA